MTDSVLVNRQGAVIVIAVNRPEARNAIDGATAAAIAAALDELDDSNELAVGILTGTGDVF